MDEARANRLVEALRKIGVLARVERSGVYQFGVAVRVDADRVAVWDSDGTAALEAQVMRNGILVGFVPTVPGSEHFTEAQVVDAIAAADYDAPVGRSPSSSAKPSRPAGRSGQDGGPRSSGSNGGGARPKSGLLGRLLGRRPRR